MLDGIKELTLQVSYLIPLVFRWFDSKGFPVIKYTCIPCLKIATLCLCLMWFDYFYGSIAYSDPCQTSKTAFFCENGYLQRGNLLA